MGPGGTSLLWPQNPLSQVPDLNGSRAALQAAAWPLRQLGTVREYTIIIEPYCLLKQFIRTAHTSLIQIITFGWRLGTAKPLIYTRTKLPSACTKERSTITNEPFKKHKQRHRYNNIFLDLSISICGLNTSLPSCLHPRPINPVFYRRSITKSLFERSFKLRCFQFLSLAA